MGWGKCLILFSFSEIKKEKHFWTLACLGSVKEGRAAGISEDRNRTLPIPFHSSLELGLPDLGGWERTQFNFL